MCAVLYESRGLYKWRITALFASTRATIHALDIPVTSSANARLRIRIVYKWWFAFTFSSIWISIHVEGTVGTLCFVWRCVWKDGCVTTWRAAAKMLILWRRCVIVAGRTLTRFFSISNERRLAITSSSFRISFHVQFTGLTFLLTATLWLLHELCCVAEAALWLSVTTYAVYVYRWRDVSVAFITVNSCLIWSDVSVWWYKRFAWRKPVLDVCIGSCWTISAY